MIHLTGRANFEFIWQWIAFCMICEEEEEVAQKIQISAI